jgi:hypothetical protein
MPTSKTKMKKPAAKVVAMPAPMPSAPMPQPTAVVLPMRPKPIAAKHAVKKAASKKARKVVATMTKKRMAAPKRMAAAGVKKPARKSGPRLKK